MEENTGHIVNGVWKKSVVDEGNRAIADHLEFREEACFVDADLVSECDVLLLFLVHECVGERLQVVAHRVDSIFEDLTENVAGCFVEGRIGSGEL